MNAYARLAELAQAPWRKTDARPLVAVFPMWFPYEILVAGGLRASEWWGFSIPTTSADAHFPPYVCTLVKSNFEAILDGGHRPDGMVFPSATCDSIQNCAGLFRRLFPKSFAAAFRMTQNPESGGAKDFLESEIRRLLAEAAASVGRKITDDDLRRAIAGVNAWRGAARRLLAKLAGGKTSVPAAQVYTALKGAAADIGPETAKLLDEFSGSFTTTEASGAKLMLVGMTPEPLDALDAIEQAGARIVGDDLGLGWRTIAVDAATTGDPVEALAQRLLSSPPCSSLHFAAKRRSDAIIGRAKELGASGIVFTRIKFCDPEAFDYPNLKKALDAASLPSLLLERELSAAVDGGTATRLEAFIEQIG
jgi:benzoyl-CoA reductase/2-hydroxyglutaryl-CoA dehydratase subunit BcrC/BadD/HgdB